MAIEGKTRIGSSRYSGAASAPIRLMKVIVLCVALFGGSGCQDNRVTAPEVVTLVPLTTPTAAAEESALQVSQQYVPYDPLSVFGVSYEAFNADPYVISDAQFAAAAEATTLPIGPSWAADGEYVETQLTNTYNPGDGPPIEPTGTDPEPIGMSLGDEQALSQTLTAIEALSTGTPAGWSHVDNQAASTDACWTMYLRAARRCRRIPLPQGRRYCWAAAMVAYAACRAATS